MFRRYLERASRGCRPDLHCREGGRLRWLLPGFAIIGLLSCGKYQPVDGDKICADVLVAIASRTLECTGNEKLANRRYERFEGEIECIANVVESDEIGYVEPATMYGCHIAILEYTCSYVHTYGGDLAAWLANGDCAYVAASGGDLFYGEYR